jgi:hypothetical protein
VGQNGEWQTMLVVITLGATLHRCNAQEVQVSPLPFPACQCITASTAGTDLNEGVVFTPQKAAQPLVVHLQSGRRWLMYNSDRVKHNKEE